MNKRKDIDDRARFKRVMDCMDMDYFTTVFNKLVNDWQRDFKDDKRRPSIRTLSTELGVSNTAVGDWMHGKSSDIQYKHFKRICDFFHVEPEVFAPNYIFLFPDYSLEQIKALDEKCSTLGIDKNLLTFIKENYSIPHELADDPFVDNPTLRPPAPKKAETDFVINGETKKSFMDEQDLDLVFELQNKIKEMTEEFLTAKAVEYEKEYVKHAASWSVVGNPGDDNFERHVQNIIEACPHLDQDYIIKACKDAHKKSKKKK